MKPRKIETLPKAALRHQLNGAQQREELGVVTAERWAVRAKIKARASGISPSENSGQVYVFSFLLALIDIKKN